MEAIDFTKPTTMYDVIILVEGRKLYCNRAILSIWSPVFEIMFKSNFKEKDSMEISLPGWCFFEQQILFTNMSLIVEISRKII